MSTPATPYPGIRPFREDEEYLFFGRESQVDAMVDTLARSRFLAVIGSSGCGKSSLVNCGLRPALHRGLLTRAGSADYAQAATSGESGFSLARLNAQWQTRLADGLRLRTSYPVLAWIGVGKFVKMEAHVLIEHNPLMSWIYLVLSHSAVATALGAWVSNTRGGVLG